MDRLLEGERELIKLFKRVLNLKYVDHKIHETPEETNLGWMDCTFNIYLLVKGGSDNMGSEDRGLIYI